MQQGEQVPVLAVLTGSIAELGLAQSAIHKQPRDGKVMLRRLGLEGDQQADRRFHGGEDKALHHYARDHYPVWHAEYPTLPPFPVPGGFGENVSTLGMVEETVCFGDVYRLGGALVQVTQPRQPCWKLNIRFGHPDFARRVQDSGRTGWYYRVLREGEIAAGDSFILEGRPYPDWSMARLLRLWYGMPLDQDGLRAVLDLADLPERWRATARLRLETGRVEEWGPRLLSPA